MPSREQRRKKSDQKIDIDKTLPAERRKRHPIMYAGSIILLVIIVVAFVGGPLVGRVGANQPIIFGTYGGEEIKYSPGNYLARQTEILYDQLQNSGSQSYEYQAYQVWKGAYDRTVVRTAMLQEADRAGLYISDNKIDEILLTTGPYMENGVFSETRYRNTPNSEKFQFRTLYREEYTQQLYLQDMLHNGIHSSKEADFIKTMAADERSFRYVVFSYDNFPVEAVAAYALENSDQFRKMKLSRITIKSSREEAETIRGQIIDGTATFEDQARNYSTDAFAEEGGEMGWRDYYSLVGDFTNTSELEALFRLGKDELSGVFETSFGFVIYRADEEAVEPDLEDPDTITSVREYMERFERGLIEDNLLVSAEEYTAAARDNGFGTAAGTFGLDILTTGSFPINYGNSYFFSPIEDAEGSTSLGSAAFDETLLTMLFSLDEGEVSDPIVLSDSIGVFELAGLNPLTEDDVEFIGDYYPFIVQQNLEQDLNNFILSSDAFEDNFTEVFSQVFLNQ